MAAPAGLPAPRKRSTADAPIGATIKGEMRPLAEQIAADDLVKPIASKAPRHAINRSRKVAPANMGENKRKRRRRLDPTFGETGYCMTRPILSEDYLAVKERGVRTSLLSA